MKRLNRLLTLISLTVLVVTVERFSFTRRDFIVLLCNSLIYAFAIFAYAAFDRLVVGLVYAAAAMCVILVLLFTSPTPIGRCRSRCIPQTRPARLHARHDTRCRSWPSRGRRHPHQSPG
jgi:hypothetical protein